MSSLDLEIATLAERITRALDDGRDDDADRDTINLHVLLEERDTQAAAKVAA